MKISNVVLNEVQIGFPALFQPKPNNFNPSADPKYSAMLVIGEGDALNTIAEAIQNIMDFEFQGKQGVRNPLVKAWDKEGYYGKEVFKDKYLINVSNKSAPSVVHRDLTPMSESDGQRLLYPGAKVNAWLTLSSYDRGAAGVAGWIEGVQHVGDGPRLDEKATASSMFTSLPPTKAEGASRPAFLDIS